MKILIVFGTRPEAIKLAPIIRAFDRHEALTLRVCVTAQHREMLDKVLALFEVTPDYDLDLMEENQSLSNLTSRVLLGVTDVLLKEKPDILIVQGDTITSFAASLAAFYLHIPIAHVEAGLRTGDLQAPFPEEGSRRMITHLASLHFAPTEMSKQNLLNEQIDPKNIVVTGNTVIDALLWVREHLKIDPAWAPLFGTAWKILQQHQPVILITCHRRESFGEGFLQICDALARIAKSHPEWHLVYPVHLNPNVQMPVKKYLAEFSNVHLIDPLDYAPFVYLMDKSTLILTDSGGIQEEAPSLGKPVLLMRDITERPEAVKAGTVKLVGTDSDNIVKAVSTLMLHPREYKKMSIATNPYGDGNASEIIINALLSQGS